MKTQKEKKKYAHQEKKVRFLRLAISMSLKMNSQKAEVVEKNDA